MASYSTSTYIIRASDKKKAEEEGKTIQQVIRERETAQREAQSSSKKSSSKSGSTVYATPKAAQAIVEAYEAGDPEAAKILQKGIGGGVAQPGQEIGPGTTVRAQPVQEITMPEPVISQAQQTATQQQKIGPYAQTQELPTSSMYTEPPKAEGVDLIIQKQGLDKYSVGGYYSDLLQKGEFFIKKDTKKQSGDLAQQSQIEYNQIASMAKAEAIILGGMAQKGMISSSTYFSTATAIETRANLQIADLNKRTSYFTAASPTFAPVRDKAAEPDYSLFGVDRWKLATQRGFSSLNTLVKKSPQYYFIIEPIATGVSKGAAATQSFFAPGFSEAAKPVWGKADFLRKAGKWESDVVFNFIGGTAEGVKEKPYTAGFNFAIAQLTGGAFKWAGGGVAKAGAWYRSTSFGQSTAGKILQSSAKGIGKGAGASVQVGYAASVGLRAVDMSSETGEPVSKSLGRIFGYETIPFFTGAYIGARTSVKPEAAVQPGRSGTGRAGSREQTQVLFKDATTGEPYIGYRMNQASKFVGQKTLQQFPMKQQAKIAHKSTQSENLIIVQSHGKVEAYSPAGEYFSIEKVATTKLRYDVSGKPVYAKGPAKPENLYPSPTQKKGVSINEWMSKNQGSLFTSKKGSFYGGGAKTTTLLSFPKPSKLLPAATFATAPISATFAAGSSSLGTAFLTTGLVGSFSSLLNTQKTATKSKEKLGVLEKQGVSTFSSLTFAPITLTRMTQETKPITERKQTMVPKEKQGFQFAFDSISIQDQSTIQKQKQLPALRYDFFFPSPTIPILPTKSDSITPQPDGGGESVRPGWFDWGSEGGGFLNRKSGNMAGGKFTTYMPSWTAIGMNIFGKKPKGPYFGLTLRPLLR